MRHRIAGVRLSRTSAHRKALFSNLIAALFTHERIRTTDAKAKETRRLAERTITWARRVSDVLGKKPDRRSHRGVGARRSRDPHGAPRGPRSRRRAEAVRRAGAALLRPPRAATRASSSCRQRPGDAAPMSLLELMPEEAAARRPSPPARATRPRRAPPRQGRQGRQGRGQGRRKGPRQEGPRSNRLQGGQGREKAPRPRPLAGEGRGEGKPCEAACGRGPG